MSDTITTQLQAKDLRIGNWVESTKRNGYFPAGFVKVESINGMFINAWSEGNASGMSMFSELRPIPLTPEILEKCGFAKEWKMGSYGYSFLKDGFELYKAESWDCYQWAVVGRTGEEVNTPEIDVPYLHQLQNLYWCLCGKELEVNL